MRLGILIMKILNKKWVEFFIDFKYLTFLGKTRENKFTKKIY